MEAYSKQRLYNRRYYHLVRKQRKSHRAKALSLVTVLIERGKFLVEL